MRILLAEDDAVLRDGLSRSLKQAGYTIDCVSDGGEADNAIFSHGYDLVILDIGLPKIDGLDVLGKMRKRSVSTPVLVLTARDTVEDRVTGLDRGADDYMTKPFDLSELEARIRSLMRRSKATGSEFLQNGPLKVDIAGKRAYANEQPLDLSAREFGVLESLMTLSGKIVNKDQLAGRLCGWGEEVGNNAIEVYVHRLRKKLEPYGVTIRTIRGLGYLMENRNDKK